MPSIGEETGPPPTKLETERSLVMSADTYRGSYSWPSHYQYAQRPTNSFSEILFTERHSVYRSCVDVGVQACGTAGLAETVVMFGYVLQHRGKLNGFEELFFLTTTGVEMAAEMFYLLAGIVVYFAGYRQIFLRAMITSPVHHYARALLLGGSRERNTVYFTLSNVAMFVGLTSLVPWALFCPEWIHSFEAESGGVMIALSAWSCAGVIMLILSVAFSLPFYDFCRHSSDWSQVMIHSIVSLVSYVSIKVFQVYILLSNPQRLCAGSFGKALVGLQISEITSITAFVAALLVSSPRCKVPEDTRPSKEDDWLRAKATSRPSEFFDPSLFPGPALVLSRESSSSWPV